MKTTQFVRLFTIVLIALCGLGPLSAQNTAPFEGFDDYVNRSMKEWEIPGMAVAIVKDDKVVFAKGYGVRDIG
ncbi:MAG: serine hydrolase, partial [Acidobacteria bacterium]|nr:serine hydrolase [Acidobacteriota bacterium]